MKKVIFKNGLRAFLATFCFLVLGVVGVMAQSQIVGGMVPGVVSPATPNTPLYNVPQGTFLSSTAALDKLNFEIAGLKAAMAVQGIDPAIFDAYMLKARYFGSIAEYIKVGATVPNAIVAGLWQFLPISTDGSGIISTAVQQSLKTDAINLLQ